MKITLDEKDIRNMPEALRFALLKFIEESLYREPGATENTEEFGSADYHDKSVTEPIEFVRPNIIPIELACSVVSGLNENSRNLLEALVNNANADKPSAGLSRTDILDLTGIKMGSINGTIGSINRRLVHRFNREVYDLTGERTHSNLISLGHDGLYKFQTPKSALNFQIAFLILKSRIFFDQADIEIILPKEPSAANPKSDQKNFLDDHSAVKIQLSSEAYFDFERGEGCIDFYRRIPELEISKEANLFSGNRKKIWAMREAGVQIHGCCKSPCNSMEWRDGKIKIIQIGPIESTTRSNKFEPKIDTRFENYQSQPLKSIVLKPSY